MSHLRRKFARILALLALIAGLTGAAVPGPAMAAPAQPAAAHHMAMDCDHASPAPAAPTHRFPAAADCCVANICAMSLALPAAVTGVALPAFAGAPDYDLPNLDPPAGIITAPIPHPPKFPA